MLEVVRIVMPYICAFPSSDKLAKPRTSQSFDRLEDHTLHPNRQQSISGILSADESCGLLVSTRIRPEAYRRRRSNHRIASDNALLSAVAASMLKEMHPAMLSECHTMCILHCFVQLQPCALAYESSSAIPKTASR